VTTVSSHRRSGTLVARSRRIDDPGDLLEHLGPDGFAWLDGDTGFVTAGVVARVPVAEASTELEAILDDRADDTPASAGPRLVGALPFDDVDDDAQLLLPARIVAREADGVAWTTEIHGVDPPAPLRRASESPNRFAVHAASTRAAWNAMVATVLDGVGRHEVEKVVLARAVEVEADAPFDIVDVLRDLHAAQPGCTVYGVDGFVGASPEILVRRHGPQVYARPLAGTAADPATLLASAKDAREHRIVVDAIVGALRSCCDRLTVDGPAALQFTSVTHLATTIRGALADRDLTALDLATRLHPTPAVGGWPTARAQQLIRELEPDRGRYAGACGWVDPRGDGEFVVALRCAQLDGAHARCYAGAGIVAGSDAAAEWAETQAKLQPMLRALVKP
jgi:menaquinone-specific isochorismate synthase